MSNEPEGSESPDPDVQAPEENAPDQETEGTETDPMVEAPITPDGGGPTEVSDHVPKPAVPVDPKNPQNIPGANKNLAVGEDYPGKPSFARARDGNTGPRM